MNNDLVTRAAVEAVCRERCAQLGEPPCFQEFPDDWMTGKSNCDCREIAPIAARAALSVSGDMREALEAVQGAMLNGGDGVEGDFGWNITKLNKARPLIRAALSPQQKDRDGE